MKKEIKNFGKYVETMLIILTLISLIINIFMFSSFYIDTSDILNNLISSTAFNILFWTDNILIYLISVFYIIDTIQQKKDIFLKLSFCFFSICTTIVIIVLTLNGIAAMFGVN